MTETVETVAFRFEDATVVSQARDDIIRTTEQNH